jgi:transmembrane sensor
MGPEQDKESPAITRSDNVNVFEEAARWLVELDGGRADAAAFAVWRDSNSRHAAAFDQVVASWKSLEDIRRLPPDHISAMAEAQHERIRPDRRFILRAAAGCGAAIFAAGLLTSRVYARQYASTVVGERRTIPLGDGSTVELNTDTSVSWRFGGSARRFWIERGEAGLIVAADPARPFLLNVRDATLQLNGGAFNVEMTSVGAEILMLTGNAAVAKNDSRSTAEPRHEVDISARGLTTRAISDREISNSVAWRRGEIIFDGTPLSAAVEEYNRYLQRKMVIGDQALGRIRLGGRFVTADPRDFLAALELSFNIKAQDNGSGVIVLIR